MTGSVHACWLGDRCPECNPRLRRKGGAFPIRFIETPTNNCACGEPIPEGTLWCWDCDDLNDGDECRPDECDHGEED